MLSLYRYKQCADTFISSYFYVIVLAVNLLACVWWCCYKTDSCLFAL